MVRDGNRTGTGRQWNGLDGTGRDGTGLDGNRKPRDKKFPTAISRQLSSPQSASDHYNPAVDVVFLFPTMLVTTVRPVPPISVPTVFTVTTISVLTVFPVLTFPVCTVRPVPIF